MKITKRDGRKVEFDSDKIVKAISKAFIEVYPDGLTDEMQTCAHRIANEVSAHDGLTVEEIQDTVVRKLMASKYKDVAKAYVEYRYLHRMARSQYAQLMDAIAEKLEARDVKNQNANVDEHSFGGRVGEASSVVNRKYALEYLVSPMAKANHINNEVYIHDLDSYAVGMHNCLSIPFDDLLANGFNTRQTDVRPAQSINTAFQLVAVIFQLQSRSGNQLPFSSINYGTCTLPEGRMVIKALLDVSIKGMGKLHKTSIFPCGIFQCMNGLNRHPSEPKYVQFRLALKSTSLRLYPNYANVDWSGNAGYDRNDPRTYFSTMGCRTANGWDINGFGQLKDGRGNICPVTIIMPTLAMEAKAWVDEQEKLGNHEDMTESFMFILDKKIHEAKDMLIERFNWICSQSPDSAKFMYENHTMAGYVPEEGIRSALKHGTLAIGQLGLAETLQILIGCDHTTPEGMKLAKRIEQLFKTRCAEFKEQEHLNFGVYYTPAENLCYTAMQKFKAKYGEIPNVSDKEFFTNSIHVPVWRKVNPIEKIDIESQLTGYSSAGCITYVELESSVKHNIDGLEALVNYAMDKDIPYFAINVPNDLCMDCGYTEEIGDTCPICGGKHIQRLRRVTGYLTGDYATAFNNGKQQEVEMRVKHDEVMTE